MLLESEILAIAEREDMLVMSDIISILKLQVSYGEDDTDLINESNMHNGRSLIQVLPARALINPKVSDDDEMSVEQKSRIRRENLKLNTSNPNPSMQQVNDHANDSQDSSWWSGADIESSIEERKAGGVKPTNNFKNITSIRTTNLPSDFSRRANLNVLDFQEQPVKVWKYILEFSKTYWSTKPNYVDPKRISKLLQEKYNDALYKYQDQ